MADKMRELQTYLELQIQETERLATISASIHDTTAAEKWEAAADAYKDVYCRIFGEYKPKGNPL